MGLARSRTATYRPLVAARRGALGCRLNGAKKQRFEEVELELAELSTKFTNNVLDATKAFSRC